MPMDRPGIDFRPLKTIAGSTEFGELFLDGVRVPVANRMGEENDGWRVTMVTLSFERGTAFVSEVLQSMEVLRDLRSLARRTGAWFEGDVRRRIGHVGAELDALWALARRNVSQAARTGVPGIGGSVYKLALSELRQRIGEFGMDLIGGAGLSWDELDGLDGGRPIGNAEQVNTWVHGFSRTIAAGTSQIQRNIIAERMLSLPEVAEARAVDFELSEQQAALAKGIHNLCAGRFPLERLSGGRGRRRRLDAEGWAELAEAGVFSLQVPEADGGVGLGMAAAAVAFEELRRALVPGPLLASHLAAGTINGAAEGKASSAPSAGPVPREPTPWSRPGVPSAVARAPRGGGRGRAQRRRPRRARGGGPRPVP